MDEFRMEKWGKRHERNRELVRRHYGPNAPEPLPTVEIAKLAGLTKTRVGQIACRLRISGHRDQSKNTKENRDYIRENIHKMPVMAIAKHLGMANDTVYKYARQMGLIASPEPEPEPELEGRNRSYDLLRTDAERAERIERYAAIIAAGGRLFEPVPMMAQKEGVA